MTFAMGSTLPWVSLLLIACMAVSAVAAPYGQLFGQINRITVFSIPPSSRLQKQLYMFRGGAASDENDADEYDSEYDSDEDEGVEPIATKAKTLATSTKSATQKKALKQTAALKSKVSVAMASSSSTSSKAVTKKKGVYKRFVPYIIRACLNPFTLVAMTKAYFVSLLDINYLKEVSGGKIPSCLCTSTRFMYIP
jgi:hypothetical protein